MISTISDVKIFEFPSIHDHRGKLTFFDYEKMLPFSPKRSFFVSVKKKGTIRGEHSHFKTEQVLCCLHGKIEIIVKDGFNQKSFYLTQQNKMIYIPSMIWDEQIYLTNNTILLSYASTEYDEADYIREYAKFLDIKNENK